MWASTPFKKGITYIPDNGHLLSILSLKIHRVVLDLEHKSQCKQEIQYNNKSNQLGLALFSANTASYPTQKINFQQPLKVDEILPHIVMIKIISMQALREMIIPGAGAQGAP